MTLPPGLKAVRDIPEWRCIQIAEHVPALLDLIETLAGALEHLADRTGHNHECRARAALDKYREFK